MSLHIFYDIFLIFGLYGLKHMILVKIEPAKFQIIIKKYTSHIINSITVKQLSGQVETWLRISLVISIF